MEEDDDASSGVLLNCFYIYRYVKQTPIDLSLTSAYFDAFSWASCFIFNLSKFGLGQHTVFASSPYFA